MRRSPSIVPDNTDRDVYLVLDDFGRLGRSWRETDEQSTDRAAIIQDLLEGQYNGPVKVVAFNTVEGWSRDVSEDIADELVQLCNLKGQDVPASLEDFIDRYGGGRPEQLPLPLRRKA
jgi:hypothetical protein